MIRIGTRGSRLALVQAAFVREKILKLFPQESVELVPVVTKGDRERERPLASFGGKGVFTGELEKQLLEGKFDMAVHSAKDMPAELAYGLKFGAAFCREDARDVLVSIRGVPASALPAGSVIGTSSPRRKVQMLDINSGVRIKDLRGNVPTRLEKLREGQYDGIILAAAGLKRLGLEKEPDLQYEYFSPQRFLPAAGQGILAVEIREGTFKEIMEELNDKRIEAQLKAEKRFLAELGGGCNIPCGVYCAWEKGQITMTGMYAPDSIHSRYARMVMQKSADTQHAAAVKQLEKMAERLADRLRKGRVALVGAGPGRMGCISLEGLECVRRAEVIVYDNLISPSILNEAGLDAELIYVGKRADDHAMSQEKIQELLIKKAESGRDVVRLKGGDSFVFGRGGEELLALRAREIPVHVVSGISSAYSVPASAGIPVTHRQIASSLHIITGHERQKNQESIDYTVLAKESGTLVFLMGLRRIREICGSLIRGGKPAGTPVAVISRGMTARQSSVFGSLSDIADKVEEEEIATPAIIVVGEVVSLAQGNLSLEEVGKTEQYTPLMGKRILLTGTRRQVKKLEPRLKALGGEAVCLSLVETKSLFKKDETQEMQWEDRLSDYQWIVFTSAKGVEAFFERLQVKGLDRRRLSDVRFAVVGSGTGEALSEQGYYADMIPSVYTSEKLAEELCTELAPTDRVLLVRGKRGSVYLENMLVERKIAFDRATLYETVIDNRRGEELNRIYDDMDYVVVASGSGAEALAYMLSAGRRESMKKPRLKEEAGGEKGDGQKSGREKPDRGRPGLVAIGPETAAACSAHGLMADIVASVHSNDGILQAIVGDIV